MSLDNALSLAHKHLYLTSVFGLLLVLAIAAIFLAFRTQRSKRATLPPKSKQEAYKERMDALLVEARKTVEEIRSKARSYRNLNTVFTVIEITGGAYFAISGSISAIFDNDQSKVQAVGNLVIGFLIAVTSGCQHAFHPFTKARIWLRRSWILEYKVNEL